MNKRTLIAAPLSIIFQDQSLLLLFEDDHKTEIQYTELIVVYLAAKNGSTGEIYMPCITEVTADMDGYIIIYGARWTMSCIHIRQTRLRGNCLSGWRNTPGRGYLVMSRGLRRYGWSFSKKQFFFKSEPEGLFFFMELLYNSSIA